MRYNIKRRTKNIEKHFKANYFVWGEIATLPNAINKLAALHKKRWDSRSTDYAFSTDEFNAFQQAAARDFSRKGWLYLSCLELNGDIAGIFYDFLYRNKLYYFQGGFEPSFNKYSIGLVLRANVIRDAIESGVGEIDLLKGAYDHKYRWTSLDRQTVTLTVGRNSPASKLFFYKTFALPSTKAQIKNLLPHSALTMVHRIRRSKMTNTNIPTD